MRFQQKDKFPIEIAKEKPNDDSIKQFHWADLTYSIIYRHRKIVVPKQSQKNGTIAYYAIQVKLGPN